jgi:hypothetical protein
MPSSNYTRNKAWYLAREASDEGLRKRSVRGKARTAAINDGRLTGKDDPREVHHVKALSKGGAGGKTKILSATANRKQFTK